MIQEAGRSLHPVETISSELAGQISRMEHEGSENTDWRIGIPGAVQDMWEHLDGEAKLIAYLIGSEIVENSPAWDE
jgi:hypothetical protein